MVSSGGPSFEPAEAILETRGSAEQPPSWTPSGPSQRPLFRLIAAFCLSVPILAWALSSAPPSAEAATAASKVSWMVCAALAGWNAVEYGLGKAPHGAATPAWLRWVLAAPYFAVTWVGVRTVAALVAALAQVAASVS